MSDKIIARWNQCHAWLCGSEVEKRQSYLSTYDPEYIKNIYILCEPTRFRIALLLQEAEKLCVCDLANILGLTVSAVSQHLSKLHASQWLNKDKVWNTIYYSLRNPEIVGNMYVPTL